MKKEPPASSTLTVQNADNNIVAKVQQQDFRAWFYMLTGKPDSKVKLFSRPIILSPSDATDLNDRVRDKLNNHHVTEIVTTATVQFHGKNAVEFGTWPEFQSFNWKIPERTESVTLKWDFLLELPGFDAPQRHTLLVKLTTPVTPQQFFQLIFSSGTDDLDELDPHTATCVCRVDFINHVLADELVHLVDKWNDAIKKHPSAKTWFDNLEKKDGVIAKTLHYAPAVIFTFLAGLILFRITKHIPADAPLTIAGLRLAFYWLLGTGLALFTLTRTGKYFASQVYTAINSYGSRAAFSFTRGDDNYAGDVVEQNRKCVKKFFIMSGLSVVLAVVQGLACWLLLPG